jgi:Delta7-sterol 5-desaturase
MPDAEMFDQEKKYAKETWDRQIKEMEMMTEEVEGKDERVYAVDVVEKKEN